MRTTAPISGGKRAFRMNVPSTSKKNETLRCSCCSCASFAASRRCVQRYLRTSFSTCSAVPCRATCTSTDSFAAVATRVIARTFEYEISPFANASAISGSCSSARATRTFSRAATGADAALPVQPLRGVGEAVTFVPFRAIELRDQREEARRRGVQISPELRDLRFELLEPALLAVDFLEPEGAAQAMGDLR